MRYLIRSTKKFIIPALALALILTAAITVFCFITLRNTAVCNRIEIWIEACDYVDFFLPLAVCLAFTPFFYFINRKGFIRYASVRAGKKRYLITHFLATAICTVLVVFVSYYATLCISFATLFVVFGNLLALYTDNLFVSVLGPFVYCMAENLITSLLNLPMYSIMTTYVLNRLSPSCMHVHNYLIGCFTYILITLGIILIIRRKKENVNVRN